MNVEPHDLDLEFPEFKDAIAGLRASNPHFAGLFEAYHKLDVEVRGLEEQDVPVADLVFEELKKQRLVLKDELYAILRGQASA